jgi:hypothetical protein
MIVAVLGAAIAAALELAYGTPECAAESASFALFIGIVIASKLDDLRSCV